MTESTQPIKILDKLREFVKAKFNINLSNFFTINITNSGPTVHYNDNRTLQINLSDPTGKNELAPFIKDAVLKEKMLLIEKNVEKMIEDVQKNEEDPDTVKLLDKLRPFLPDGDLSILRACLVLKRKHREGYAGVQKLKDDIVERYGDRGRTIANLCSAGYFENEIVPTLDALGPNIDKPTFLKWYDVMISESCFAIFVSMFMTTESLKSQILQKIKDHLQYGVYFLRIHGIGKENIKTIRKTVNLILEEYEDRIQKTNEEISGLVISLKLVFTRDLTQDLDGQEGTS